MANTIKVVGTIVNTDLMLIGFNIDTGKGVQAYSTEDLKAMAFENHQIKVTPDGRMSVKNNFKLNAVPMQVWMGQGNFQPINNTLLITGRENNGTEDTAYQVKVGNDRVATLTAQQLRKIQTFFKPVNFVVSRRDDTGTIYVTSKPGYPKISELPIVGGMVKQLAQRAYKANVQAPNGALSFWNLCTTIDSMNGVFIKLPHVKYNAESRMVIPADSTAKDISDYGEFALPKLEVVITNANLNLQFQAAVKVDITDTDGNKQFDLWSNRLSTKTVYKNGKVNMSEIGILVKKTVAAQLEQILSGYDWGRLEDAQLRKFYAKSVGKNSADDLMIIWLSLENVPAFTDNDIKTMAGQLHSMDQFVQDIYDYTCMKKANTQFSKLKREATKAGLGVQTVHPELAHFTPEQLKLIALAGIDTKYNNYTYKVEKTADSEDGKATKSEFAIKWEFPKLAKVNVDATAAIATAVEEFTKVLAEAYKAGDIDKANAFIKNIKDRTNEIAKIIQLTNFVMLYKGGFTKVVAPKSNAACNVELSAAKTNTYIVLSPVNKTLDGTNTPLEQARAIVSGWDVTQ